MRNRAARPVRLKRAHAKSASQGEGLPEVRFRPIRLWRLASGRDLAEEAEGRRLVAPLLVPTREG